MSVRALRFVLSFDQTWMLHPDLAVYLGYTYFCFKLERKADHRVLTYIEDGAVLPLGLVRAAKMVAIT
jgi:hypothetical protein